jgi:hypothetical protein
MLQPIGAPHACSKLKQLKRQLDSKTYTIRTELFRQIANTNATAIAPDPMIEPGKPDIPNNFLIVHIAFHHPQLAHIFLRRLRPQSQKALIMKIEASNPPSKTFVGVFMTAYDNFCCEAYDYLGVTQMSHMVAIIKLVAKIHPDALVKHLENTFNNTHCFFQLSWMNSSKHRCQIRVIKTSP